jgi:hypothetical protein
MRRWRLAMLSVVVILSLSAPGYGAETTATPAEPSAKAKDDDRLPIYPRDEWQFYVSPYIWIPGVNLNINALRASTSTNIAWWDIASRLFTNAIGVMGRAEAWKGRWGLYFDGYFTYLGASGSQVGATRTQTLGPVNFAIDRPVTVNGATFRLNLPGQASGSISLTPSGSASFISRVVGLDMGGRYLVGTRSWQPDREFPVLSLEILGGLRFSSFNQFLKLNYSVIRVNQANVDFRRVSLSAERQSINNGSYTLDSTLQVFEPFIGPRIYIWFNPKVLLSLKGTVGGFGLVAYNSLTCDLEALLGYRVTKTIYAYGGYRARGFWMNFGEGQAKVSLAGWFNGPVLGSAFKF